MHEIFCSECATPLTSENILVCPACGKMMCTPCAERFGKLCCNCYSDLSYLQ